MGAPGGTVTDGRPPKVSARSDPASIATPLPASATCAAPITSGRVPYSFENSTRTWLPPRLTRATCRMVWSRSERGIATGAKKSASQTGCGLAAQVGIQSPSSAARSGEPNPAVSPAARASATALHESDPGPDAKRSTIQIPAAAAAWSPPETIVVVAAPVDPDHRTPETDPSIADQAGTAFGKARPEQRDGAIMAQPPPRSMPPPERLRSVARGACTDGDINRGMNVPASPAAERLDGALSGTTSWISAIAHVTRRRGGDELFKRHLGLASLA